ncbi:MAG: ATP-binding protein [Chloroflexota bacterium]|nr:ATP-binding protein [Chloroflexota bacterium]
MPVAWKSGTVYMWRPCDQCALRWETEYQLTVAGDLAARQAQAERELGDTGLRRIASFTFDSFQPERLHSKRLEEHPLALAQAWLEAIGDRPHGDYADDSFPPPALYFYSPGKGRGKTHLAGAMANAARARGKLVAFLEETSYLERRWSCQLTEIERLTALPGDHAWLTVIDDLGQRGKASEAVADAWYAVINRRWLKRGWTIFTSNRFPEELVDQGTINEATYSRLMQMIGMRGVFFDGEDRRLA